MFQSTFSSHVYVQLKLPTSPKQALWVRQCAEARCNCILYNSQPQMEGMHPPLLCCVDHQGGGWISAPRPEPERCWESDCPTMHKTVTSGKRFVRVYSRRPRIGFRPKLSGRIATHFGSNWFAQFRKNSNFFFGWALPMSVTAAPEESDGCEFLFAPCRCKEWLVVSRSDVGASGCPWTPPPHSAPENMQLTHFWATFIFLRPNFFHPPQFFPTHIIAFLTFLVSLQAANPIVVEARRHNTAVEFLRAWVASWLWVCGNILWEAGSSKAFYKAVQWQHSSEKLLSWWGVYLGYSVPLPWCT